MIPVYLVQYICWMLNLYKSVNVLTIIGLGNILRGDDGIGPVIIEQLEGEIPPLKTKILDAGSDAFMVLEKLLEPGPVVVIDCAYMGEEPGQVRRIRVKDAGLLLEQFGLSMHGFSLAEVLKMAQSIGVEPDLLGLAVHIQGGTSRSR